MRMASNSSFVISLRQLMASSGEVQMVKAKTKKKISKPRQLGFANLNFLLIMAILKMQYLSLGTHEGLGHRPVKIRP